MTTEVIRVLAADSTYRIKTTGGNGERAFHGPAGIVSLRVGNQKNAITIPTDPQGALALKPRNIKPDHVLSAWKVVAGQVERGAIAGRIILIGASAPGLVDLHQTPLGQRPGTEIEAQAIAQILSGDYLQRPDWATGLEILVAALLGAGAILMLPRLPPARGAALALAICGGLGGGCYLSFRFAGLLLDPIFPALCTTAVYLTATLDSFLVSERERLFVRRAFSQYLSPSLVRELVAHPERLKIGGERRILTIMFTDIAGFTSLTERLGPEMLAPIINRYFEGISDIVMNHGGMVNQFAGDAVLAFFNAPLDQPDHAARALACARAVDLFAEAFRVRESSPGAVFGQTRIGVHTGPAVVGNFGSFQRTQYGALGDSLNTASRIEQINKYFKTRICASEATIRQSLDKSNRPLGDIQFIGKKDYLTIYEVLQSGQELSPQVQAYCFVYEQLRQGRLEPAEHMFQRIEQQLPPDGPTTFHLERLRAGTGGHQIAMDRK
jgi:adenylate cyclase